MTDALAITSRLQREGTRPPGVPEHLRQTESWETLRRAIYARAMRYGTQLNFDFRQLLTDAGAMRQAGRLMWQLAKPHAPEVLVGPGFGATPLLYGMAAAALDDGVSLQVLMVRDRRKDHNQKRWVEGHRPSVAGKRAVFVDDFMKRGSALGLVKEALAADKVDVQLVGIVLFFDMWEPLATRQISVSQLPFSALYTRHDMGLSRDCFDAVPPLMKGGAPDFVVESPRWWRFGLNSNGKQLLKCAPAIGPSGVYVADERGTLWCHERTTGEIKWSLPGLEVPEKGVVQSLQRADGSVIYGAYDGTLSRVCEETGRLLWRWKLDSWIHATPSIDTTRQRVYVSTEQMSAGKPGGHTQCLDLRTGRVLWKHRHDWWPPASTVLCEAAGVVIAACNDESVVALDAASGELLWRATTRGLVRGRPWVQDGAVFLATEKGNMHKLCVRSGESLAHWRYGQGLWHQFLLGDESAKEIYVLDGQSGFSALDADDGSIRWLGRLRSPGCWGPVRYGRYLLVLSRQGDLAVFLPQEQIKVWEGKLPGHYHQPPAAANGTLAAASTFSGLLAFDIHPHYES